MYNNNSYVPVLRQILDWVYRGFGGGGDSDGEDSGTGVGVVGVIDDGGWVDARGDGVDGSGGQNGPAGHVDADLVT